MLRSLRSAFVTEKHEENKKTVNKQHYSLTLHIIINRHDLTSDVLLSKIFGNLKGLTKTPCRRGLCCTLLDVHDLNLLPLMQHETSNIMHETFFVGTLLEKKQDFGGTRVGKRPMEHAL